MRPSITAIITRSTATAATVALFTLGPATAALAYEPPTFEPPVVPGMPGMPELPDDLLPPAEDSDDPCGEDEGPTFGLVDPLPLPLPGDGATTEPLWPEGVPLPMPGTDPAPDDPTIPDLSPFEPLLPDDLFPPVEDPEDPEDCDEAGTDDATDDTDGADDDTTDPADPVEPEDADDPETSETGGDGSPEDTTGAGTAEGDDDGADDSHDEATDEDAGGQPVGDGTSPEPAPDASSADSTPQADTAPVRIATPDEIGAAEAGDESNDLLLIALLGLGGAVVAGAAVMAVRTIRRW